MNTRCEEDEDITFNYFSKFLNIQNYIVSFFANQCLRVNNLKLNSILKSKDVSLNEFQEKSRKKDIIEKLNELVQLLKDEETKTKKSSTLSY